MTNKPTNHLEVQALLDAVQKFTTIVSKLPEGRYDQLILLSEISQVLINLNDPLRNIVNQLLHAEPGDSLKEKIDIGQGELIQLKDEIKEITDRLEELIRIESENKQVIIEKTKLEEELDIKKDLASFNPSILDTLKNEIGKIDKAKPWITALKENRDSAREIIPQMVTSSAELNDLLGKETAEEIENYNQMLKTIQENLNQFHSEKTDLETKINDVKNEIEETKKEIIKKQDEYQKAAKEHEKQITNLNAYLKADQMIAAAIDDPEARNAKGMLKQIEEQLQNVDQVLKTAMDNNQKNKALPHIQL